MANPRVTAGLMKASLLPHATAVNTPAITANAQPLVITIQPAPSAFERFNKTFATTPSPSNIKTSVPMNSPKHFTNIRNSPLLIQRVELAHPIERARYRPLPKVVHLIPFSVFQVWRPGAVGRPVCAQIIQVFEISDGQTSRISCTESGGRILRCGAYHRPVENIRLELHQ